MKKKNLLNVLMVMIILLIGFSGFMVVKNIKGNEKVSNSEITTSSVENIQNEETKLEETVKVLPMKVSKKTGIVTVERNGIAYEVDVDTELRTGDVFRTKPGSEVAFAENGNEIIVAGSNTELKVTDAEKMNLELKEGELFVDRRKTDKELSIATEAATFTPNGTTFAVTAYSASYSVYVYSGEVTASGEKINTEVTAKAGQIISALKDNDGNVKASSSEFSPNALNDNQIENLLACGIDSSFCFSGQKLNAIKTAREDEKAKAQQEMLLLEEQAKAEIKKEQEKYEQAVENYEAAIESGAFDITEDEDGNITLDSTGGSKSCTIEIRCNTFLDNMSNLKFGKEGYVPSSGKILSKTKVSFSDGETVYDVLKRVCSNAGIQMEASWTPLYNSYYIEGINHLYEFDCGSESGWMYKVNGWFPNYGCSSYYLEDGDSIVWCYTCNGLGADVGGSNF